MRGLALSLLLVTLPLVGCSGASSDDGVDASVVQKAQAPLSEAARRAGGDWAKLLSDERRMFLDRARGNEASAKQMVGFMGGRGPAGAPVKP